MISHAILPFILRASLHLVCSCNLLPLRCTRQNKHDEAVRTRAMAALATVGGVAVGALTAGVGLIPYMAIVGGAAAVGGGSVVYKAGRLPDRRLVLATRSAEEAMEWKQVGRKDIHPHCHRP